MSPGAPSEGVKEKKSSPFHGYGETNFDAVRDQKIREALEADMHPMGDRGDMEIER